MSTDRKQSGFKQRTRVDDALAALHDAVDPHGRVEHLPLQEADGRTLATTLEAPANVPSAPEAAMDGFAVRAGDSFGASDRSPEVLRVVDDDPTEGTVGPNQALRVHTGSALPEGADAVVKIEQAEPIADEVEVFDAVAEGENVAPAGEDVTEGQHLYDPGAVLRPSDLGLLKSVGFTEVPVFEKPDVTVIPTGDELVQENPGPGETIETNGLTVARFVDRWGGEPTELDPVEDDEGALKAAIRSGLDGDLVVTSGGSSVGQRDLLPEVLEDLGEIVVHGVALKPGHPFGFAVCEGTPVLMLPGYPVATIVNAVQFLRPAVKRAMDAPLPPHPTTEAKLERKIASEPGVRTFARVTLEAREDDPLPAAVPTRVSGSGVLSSVALADGWVVVDEAAEGIDAGETVAVQNWEASR
ncbi:MULTISPECIES: molybdopterin molybdotransferase MoeA [Halolamina]|uniref:Molybdopterin molybdotransferase n=1 Tax=Halolamina pelagica TaxID=699431 RepID=A0A1I5SIE9_9EURY|nr:MULTISPECIES: gephyrin-like molybdotransferase Glp [Halolamina]NHX37048.1 molybdopterin molybdotransferase MoeA [Halolamina sp. R1-12]SFP70431.1 molybdopterin molybdotransferase [Halolamina pelagica]